jgi:DNA (cytosine-5)-methyltransferase 1
MTSDINPWAEAIYRLNFAAEPRNVGDVRKLAAAAIPCHDVLTAGFPCQPFTASAAAAPAGFRDPRGQLFWQVIRLLRANGERRPQAVLLENVPGLLHNSFRRVRAAPGWPSAAPDTPEECSSALAVVLEALSSSGYFVSWRILDAQAVVPQMRPRLFIVGIRDDLDAARGFTWPQLAHPGPPLSSILEVLEEAIENRSSLSRKQWEAVRSSGYFQRSPERRVPSPEGVANTLRSSYVSGSRLFSQFVLRKNSHWADLWATDLEQPPVRFFTPRECARLQGFPDWFQLSSDAEPVPESSQYQALGNAVVPALVAPIVRALLEAVQQL